MEPMPGFLRAVNIAILDTYKNLRNDETGPVTAKVVLSPRKLVKLGVLPPPDTEGLIKMPNCMGPDWLYLKVLEYLPDLVESIYYEATTGRDGTKPLSVATFWDTVDELAMFMDQQDEEDHNDIPINNTLESVVVPKKARSFRTTSRKRNSLGSEKSQQAAKVCRLKQAPKVKITPTKRNLSSDRPKPTISQSAPPTPTASKEEVPTHVEKEISSRAYEEPFSQDILLPS